VSVIGQRRRARVGRVWRLCLQALLPGFLLHEAAHWLVAKHVAVDARLAVTPGWRVVCAHAWDRAPAWRRVAVAFAPLAFALLALPGASLVVGAWLTGGALSTAVACWAWLNLLVLGAPSGGDLRLAIRPPGADTES